MGNLAYFGGAFLLFFINTVFIALATYAGVRILRFSRRPVDNPRLVARARRYLMAIVVLTLIPAAWITIGIVQESVMRTRVLRYVKEQFNIAGTQIVSHTLDDDTHILSVVAVGREIPNADIAMAESRMPDYNLDGYRLDVIQGSQSDSLLMLGHRIDALVSQQGDASRQIVEQSHTIRDLEEELGKYTRYAELAPDVLAEVRTIMPDVEAVCLAPASGTSAGRTESNPYVVAIVDVAESRTKPATHATSPTTALGQFLKTRLHVDSLRLVVVPVNGTATE